MGGVDCDSFTAKHRFGEGGGGSAVILSQESRFGGGVGEGGGPM